jgi:hypothetical protein
MKVFCFLAFAVLFAQGVPAHAQTVHTPTSTASDYAPEQPLSLPSPNSVWTLSSGCEACRAGRALWLVHNADHHRRLVQRYGRTVRAGWSPGGNEFFLNAEQSDGRASAYVVEPTNLKTIDLSTMIAAVDPGTAKYLEATHSRLFVLRWMSSDSLMVELTGQSDEPPIDQFDLRFQVHLTGMINTLSLREWPLFTARPSN